METSADAAGRAERPRTARVLGVLATGIAVEILLFVVAIFAPAVDPLIRPAYPVVALIFALIAWRVARPRSRRDRRRGDRRGRSEM